MKFSQNSEQYFHSLVTVPSLLDSYVAHLRTVTESGTVIRVVRGSKIRSKRLLFDEFAAAFQFPLYFGMNWDAFEECISDLNWLPANEYILVVSDASSLLHFLPNDDFVLLFKILYQAASNWADGKLLEIEDERGPARFEILLQDSLSGISELENALVSIVGEIQRQNQWERN